MIPFYKKHNKVSFYAYIVLGILEWIACIVNFIEDSAPVFYIFSYAAFGTFFLFWAYYVKKKDILDKMSDNNSDRFKKMINELEKYRSN